jgi:hypothetical protein
MRDGRKDSELVLMKLKAGVLRSFGIHGSQGQLVADEEGQEPTQLL